VNTIKREQFGATVHLFIEMGHSPGKSIFMSLTSIYNHNMNH
jgi:transposase